MLQPCFRVLSSLHSPYQGQLDVKSHESLTWFQEACPTSFPDEWAQRSRVAWLQPYFHFPFMLMLLQLLDVATSSIRSTSGHTPLAGPIGGPPRNLSFDDALSISPSSLSEQLLVKACRACERAVLSRMWEESHDKFRYLALSILGVWVAAAGRWGPKVVWIRRELCSLRAIRLDAICSVTPNV